MTISDLIIETKLFPPQQQAHLVDRPQLTAKLVKNTTCPLVLIKAPAGYGKTTATADWYQYLLQLNKPAAWFSLDKLDNNIKRFMYHLVAALQRSQPKFGRAIVGQLDSPGKLSVDALATTLKREIIEIGTTMHLVLDDFHFINDTSVVNVLRYLIDNLPPNLSLVILSRRSLPIETARLKALGYMLELSINDLRFTSSEIAQFFNQKEKLQLSEHAIDLLNEKTEGWVAGLKLVSITLKDQLNSEEFISSFSGNNYDIGNYLAEEVLHKQDKDTMEFLLYTSILDRMNPDLCNALTGKSNGRQMFTKLQELGLFLIPLDTNGEWFRYHHLFSEFMQNNLHSLDPELIVKLNKLASTWFAGRKYIDEAITYALAANDMETASKLLNEYSNKIFYDGRLHILMHWIEKIDESYLNNYPRILLNYAWTLILRWRFLIARPILERVQRILDVSLKDGTINLQEFTELELVLAHREMMLSQFSDDMHSVKKQCKALLSNFDVNDAYLNGNLYTSLIYAEREFLNTRNLNEYDYKARELYKKANSIFVLIWHNSIVGPTEYVQGQTKEAKIVLTDAWKYAVEIGGESSPLAAMPALLLAEVLYELCEIDQANELLDCYLALAEKVGFVDQIIAGYTTKSKILTNENRVREAKILLQQAERIANSHDFPRLYIAILTERIRLASIDGDKAAIKNCISAMRKYRKIENMKPSKDARTIDAAVALSWCRFFRVSGELQKSILLARQWAHFCLSRGIFREYVKFNCAQITARQLQGESNIAMRLLDKTLKNIEGCQLITSFFEESTLIKRMLITMASFSNGVRNPVMEKAMEIMQTAGELPEKTGGNTGNPDQPIGALSDQELLILGKVAIGHLNKEIASELNMTLGTVKWYMQSIFNKLYVRRRSLAVQKARELGLL